MSGNESSATVWRRWEDGFLVRAMTPKDAPIVQGWYAADYADSRADLDICLQVFPPGPGFYIGEINGEVVASAVRLAWAKDVYYGSYYYVAAAYRGRGYGRRLWDEVADAHLGDATLAIDAHDELLEMYKRHGYVFHSRVHRYEGTVKAEMNSQVPDGLHMLPARSVPFDQLIEYDNKCFVGQGSAVRRAFLEKWIQVERGASFVAKDAKGHIVGFVCRRPDIKANSHLIGPLYADSPDVASALLSAICDQIQGNNIVLEVCCENPSAVEVACRFGLEVSLHMIRMNKNGKPDWSCTSVYGLTSIDVCGF